MKSIVLFTIVCTWAATSFAQKQTYEFTTFIPPKAWKKEVKANTYISYSIINQHKKTYCQIFIMLSTASKGGLKEDFESEWETLVAKQYGIAEKAQLTEPSTLNGWQVLGGVGFFKSNGTSTAMLTTMSGYNKAVSIVALTNSEDYIPAIQQFLTSVEMKKPETGSQNLQQQITSDENAAPSSLLKYSWKSTQSRKDALQNYAGYSTNTYQFKNNGTYTFNNGTFKNYAPNYYISDEEGTYKILGNTITLKPSKTYYRVHEQEISDPPVKSGNLVLETTQYRFEFTTIYDRLRLVLTPANAIETKREGGFNYYANGQYQKAYLYDAVSETLSEANNNESKPLTPLPSKQVGFSFNTTTYDDGWAATVQEDWVQVTKGSNKVLIHYPNKSADAHNFVLLDGLKNAWDILVAPRYSSASNMDFKGTGGWEAIEFAEADMTEIATGKIAHVVLFKKNYNSGSGKYVEFITPDKESFEQEFGAYQKNMSGAGFEKMENMAYLNKFAVAASDLSGKWTSDFSGAIQYVNAYTGFDAGMDTHASAENYQFTSGNTYNWDLAVASGRVGNIKFQSVKSTGKFTINGNWKANFSDIEGKPRSYDVYFSCIKGLRILWINDKPFAKAD